MAVLVTFLVAVIKYLDQQGFILACGCTPALVGARDMLARLRDMLALCIFFSLTLVPEHPTPSSDTPGTHMVHRLTCA